MANDKTKNELAPLIGHLTIEWNDIQSTVFMMFHQLMGGTVAKSISIFFAVKSDSGQRDITLSLAKEVLFMHPDLIRALTSTFSSINRMAGRRNDFIHGIWQFPDKDQGIAEIWLGVRERLSGKDPMAECEALRREIADLEYETFILYERIKEALQQPQNARQGLAGGLLQQPRAPAPSEAVRSNPDSPTAPPPPHPASDE